jgi:hypothetical protein
MESCEVRERERERERELGFVNEIKMATKPFFKT